MPPPGHKDKKYIALAERNANRAAGKTQKVNALGVEDTEDEDDGSETDYSEFKFAQPEKTFAFSHRICALGTEKGRGLVFLFCGHCGKGVRPIEKRPPHTLALFFWVEHA